MSGPHAPAAPGRLGVAVEVMAMQTYLGELDTWIRYRKDELDQLDAAALASTKKTDLTGDLTLSMALWKAVSDRQQLLMTVWNGGRVLHVDRERLSTLIWGRLDATLDPAVAVSATPTPAALAVSLPEACRLSDALAGQLRQRLALEPNADANAVRVKALRATAVRLRDQVALEEPAGRPRAERTWRELTGRIDDVADRLQQGGDVGGLLGPLENDAARFERDLIVDQAERRDTRDQAQAVEELRADLTARADALGKLAAQAVAEVAPAPRYAVPDVGALGPVPSSPHELATYRTRLGRVAQAMNLAHDSYAAALSDRDALAARLEGLALKASAQGLAAQSDLVRAHSQAQDVLARKPCPIAVAAALVDAYEAWLSWAATSTRLGKESA